MVVERKEVLNVKSKLRLDECCLLPQARFIKIGFTIVYIPFEHTSIYLRHYQRTATKM